VQALQDILGDPEQGFLLFTSSVGFLVSLVLGILVHEAGHAVVGRLTGSRIRLIRIGRGPVLFRIPLGMGLLVWRLFPTSGAVASYRPLVTVRRARLMQIAGGSFANALIAVVLAAVLPSPGDPVMHPVLTPVLLVQAGFAILNLGVVIGPGRRGTTDGGLFLAALRQPPVATDHVLTRLYATRVTDLTPDLPSEPPSALAAVVLHALVIGTPEATYTHLEALGAARAPRQGARLRERLLAQGGLTHRERAALRSA
jgi:hypothetical protein